LRSRLLRPRLSLVIDAKSKLFYIDSTFENSLSKRIGLIPNLGQPIFARVAPRQSRF
jgi:hypothetical protein